MGAYLFRFKFGSALKLYMGLFSNIFKKKEKKIVKTSSGIFTLMYSKGDKNLWQNETGEFSITVRGTAESPNAEQVSLSAGITKKIQELQVTINKRFFEMFTEAELEVDFKSWEERFKIIAVDIMIVFQGELYWNITFEDFKDSYAHFTLYIEGKEVKDFSIDT